MHERVGVISAGAKRAPAPAGADDGPIKIVEYDPAWPARYAVERARLEALLPELHICHIGSTAVPRMASKAVIDMIALVDDLEASAARVIERAGYHMPPRFNAGLDHRRFLCYPSETFRTHHLHLVDVAEDLEQCLLFRDMLRADTTLAQHYAALKRRLAAQFQGDREGYTKAKTGFILDAAKHGARARAG